MESLCALSKLDVGCSGALAPDLSCLEPCVASHLNNLLPPLMHPVVGVGAEGEAAFLDYAATLTRQMGLLASALITLCIFIWWPLDWALMPNAEHIDAFFQLRASAASLMMVACVAFWTTRLRYGPILIMSTLFYAGFLGCIGLALGRLGVMGWLGDAYLGIVPMALIPMRFGWRVAATSLVGLALVGAFFGPSPQHLDQFDALGQLSFVVFAVLFTSAVGEISYRLTRRTFFERRALDRTNASLARLTATLEEQVAEQTRDLRSLAQHLSQIQEAERRRLAHDLHDDLGQHLTAMRYTVSRLEKEVGGQPDGAALVLVEDLEALLEGTATTMRGVVSRLRPRVLDELGLEAALEWLCASVEETTAIPCCLEVEPGFSEHAARLDYDQRLVMFRCVQEGTTNALKHAEATALRVALDATPTRAAATVSDDGRGWTPTDATSGFGLLGLRERVRACGGQLLLRSAPGQGTRLCVELPLAAHPREGSP